MASGQESKEDNLGKSFDLLYTVNLVTTTTFVSKMLPLK